MNAKYRLLVLLLAILVIWRSFYYFLSEPDPKDAMELPSDEISMKVSVYYEALCPDSKFFIIYQLLPTYLTLTEYMEIDLVPYGKAKTIEKDGKITFTCQHDSIECFANKIHACAIKRVPNQLTQLKYIACMIADNMIPESIAEKCGNDLSVNSTPIIECAKSDEGSQLLKTYGIQTHSLHPPVDFIPTIELNHSQTLAPQKLILKHFLKSICNIIKPVPVQCP